MPYSAELFLLTSQRRCGETVQQAAYELCPHTHRSGNLAYASAVQRAKIDNSCLHDMTSRYLTECFTYLDTRWREVCALAARRHERRTGAVTRRRHESTPRDMIHEEAICQVVVSLEEGCKRMPQDIDNIHRDIKSGALSRVCSLALSQAMTPNKHEVLLHQPH